MLGIYLRGEKSEGHRCVACRVVRRISFGPTVGRWTNGWERVRDGWASRSTTTLAHVARRWAVFIKSSLISFSITTLIFNFTL